MPSSIGSLVSSANATNIAFGGLPKADTQGGTLVVRSAAACMPRPSTAPRSERRNVRRLSVVYEGSSKASTSHKVATSATTKIKNHNPIAVVSESKEKFLNQLALVMPEDIQTMSPRLKELLFKMVTLNFPDLICNFDDCLCEDETGRVLLEMNAKKEKLDELIELIKKLPDNDLLRYGRRGAYTLYFNLSRITAETSKLK